MYTDNVKNRRGTDTWGIVLRNKASPFLCKILKSIGFELVSDLNVI